MHNLSEVETKQVNIERLNWMIDILEDIERTNKAFDLSYWANNVKFEDSNSVVGNITELCGTTCCAMGYAALDHRFQNIGLEMIIEYVTPQDDYISATINSIAEYNDVVQNAEDFKEAYVTLKDNENLDGFEAASEIFNIDFNISYCLFYPSSYERDMVTPRMVIDRVKLVIARGNDAFHNE